MFDLFNRYLEIYQYQQRSEKKGQSTDMTSQIVTFVCPEFSVIIEMIWHFFPFSNWISVSLEIRDTLKALGQHLTMPHFFTDDNLITTLCSVHIQLPPIDCFFLDWYWILKVIYNGHTLNSHWPFIIFYHQLE